MKKEDVCPWFVLKTKSRQEKKVAQALTNQEIRMFLPTKRQASKQKNRKAVIEQPLFPGYVFVQPELSQIRNMSFIPGSCGLIFFGEEQASVPERDIEAVRIVTSADVSVTACEGLTAGEKVEIISGHLAGLQGEFVRKSRGDCLVINIHLINRSVDIAINSCDISAI